MAAERRPSTTTEVRRARERAARFNRLINGTVAVAVAGVVAWGAYEGFRRLLASPMLWINEVEISGNTRQSDDEILAAADLLRTRQLLDVRAAAIEAGVESLPWIVEAEVTVSLRGRVAIGVREAEPAGVAFLGQPYIISTEGEVIRPWMPTDGELLPLWVGFVDRIAPGDIASLAGQGGDPEAGAAIDRYSFQSARAMLAAWNARDFGEPRAIREVHLHPALGYRLVLADSSEVRLGDEEVGARLDRLQRVYAELEARGLEPSVIHANMSNVDRVVVRPVQADAVAAQESAGAEGAQP